MVPPRPPELMEDVIGEILLRLPPGEPAWLVRANLVCKTWRRLLSNRAFLHQYSAFHRTPPLLGFFQDQQYRKGIGHVSQYVSAIKPSPVPTQTIATTSAGHTTRCRIFDCRHGRVLFQAGHPYAREDDTDFMVWDPITGNQKCISRPMHPYSDDTCSMGIMAAVLCAVDGCDHLGCSVGPFLVLIMGTYCSEDGVCVAWTSLYSSKTGVWGTSTLLALESDCYTDSVLPSLLIGDTIYFIADDAKKIFMYSLVRDALSVITVPPLPQLDEENIIFAAAEEGELGVATLVGYNLQLWSWQTNGDNIGEWAMCRVIELAVVIPISIGDPSTDLCLLGFAQGAATVEGYSLHLWSWQAIESNGGIGEWVWCRVIELDVMIPISIGNPSTTFDLSGFAEGTGSIFISANDDIFTVELKSGQVTKIGKKTSYRPMFPFISFYTPGT